MTLLLAKAEEGFNWHALIVQALGFAILAVLLAKLVVPIVRKMLGERSKEIEDRFTRLDRELGESSRQLDEYRTRLERIGEETQRRIRAAEEEGAKSRANLLAEAQAQAQAEFEKGQREIQLERDTAVLELRAAVTDLTVAATERIVDGAMNQPLHDRMVDKSLGEIARGVRPS